MITPGMLPASLASVLPARALAQNTTASDEHVGWVSSGSGRSTSDILWSCFSILLVCTYKCIHFNVPSRKESEAGWFTWIWCRKWLKKMGWMMLIVLAPEIGVAMATDQYLLAREQCHKESSLESQEKRKVDESQVVEGGKKDVETVTTEVNEDEREKQEITNTHTFFANMGEFNLRICTLSLLQQDHNQGNPTLPDNGSQAEITAVAVDKAVAAMNEVSFPLTNWDDLVSYRTMFPDMKIPTEKEINDLSKADAFTKAFACIQSGWLIIQCIVRVSVGLPITQLELATMAFVVCALAMYLLWWHKPFGVESRTSLTVIAYTDSDKKILANRLSNRYRSSIIHRESLRPYFDEILGGQSRRESIQRASDHELAMHKAQMDHEFYKKDMTWDDFGDIFLNDFEYFSWEELVELGKALPIMIQNILGNPDFAELPQEFTRTLALYAIGTLFSALHLAAWNWEFPSSTVRKLWRIFAITATVTGPATILFVFALLVLLAFDINVSDTIMSRVFLFFIFIYAASRIGLVVLIFYCFSSMPAGVYETVNWLQFLPHFS
ncbi:hypothetical protein L207DRAFT_640790 [Hyaloscypha variabilis F]|uniref:DUF221-domain-containing protein n=1 Tax=Hyaloscypha variabilis (strain UAMH 11265 / GT02V1 / F) TaxID=1149755 RepID=A0A2J6QZ25_HYAVF|nr:hypothetical protein L207DRAFT_640790 [Hyaloscypha variabilis F]